MKEVKGRLLYLAKENRGLLYERLCFYDADLETGEKIMLAKINARRWKRIACKNRAFCRLLRLDPRSTVRLSNGNYLISVLHKVWLLDVEKKEFRVIFESRKNFSDNLNFCEHEGMVYWGDYGENVPHEPINIYKYDPNTGKIEVVYTFPSGEIIHIHNIFLNEDRSRFWVLAGDNEPHAGIYSVSLDWRDIKLIKGGKQCYRAVVGFPYKGGLLYATDSVDWENHLRLIEADGTEQVLTDINGSCIYGGENKDYYLFSTTVEPCAGSGFWHKFQNKLGGGIKSWDVHVIAVNKIDLTVRVLKKLHKDWFPMVLFQYGRVRFAGGQENNESGFWCSPVACDGDGKSFFFNVDSF